MAQLRDIVFDCRHPASLARFWAAALDGYAVAPYDEEELARLAAMGVPGPEEDPSVLVEGPPGAPRLFLTLVPEPKTAKNRLHLDLVGNAAEVERLVALGARVLAGHPEWTTMADPEGNEFDVMHG